MAKKKKKKKLEAAAAAAAAAEGTDALSVKALELTPTGTPLLLLECPDYSSGTFKLTLEGTFVTAAASARAAKAKKPKKR
jgi:hypothetical protein